MLLAYLLSGIFLLFGAFSGHQPYMRIEKLNKTNLLNSILAATALFTVLMAAYMTGYFPQAVAASFMMCMYSFVAGFFAGYAIRLIQLRGSAGNILYMHRSFWVDHAPGLAAILIILYGIYRTSILIDQPVTGLRLTSGLSLMAFGFFGLTLKIVPEFRSRGVLFLDRIVPWKQVIAWRWHTEEVICIEFMHRPGLPGEQVREFFTTIPPEDRKQVETVLKSKMDDSRKDRKKMLGLGED
jgi:hypothetical protein